MSELQLETKTKAIHFLIKVWKLISTLSTCKHTWQVSVVIVTISPLDFLSEELKGISFSQPTSHRIHRKF